MLQDIAPWLAIAISAGGLAYTIISGRSKAAAQKVAKLEARVDSKGEAAALVALDERVDLLEDRATKIESTLQHLPDKDITHRLEMSIQGLRSEVAVLSERVKPVAAIAGRLQEAMLERAQS